MSYTIALLKTIHFPGDVCSQYTFTDEVLLDISYSGLFIAKFCNKYTNRGITFLFQNFFGYFSL